MTINKHITLTACLLLFFCAGRSDADSFSLFATNSFTLEKSGHINRQTLLFAQDADIAGTMENDLFLFSNKSAVTDAEPAIKLSGEFLNDILVVADAVTLSGHVHDHARILARTITVDGSVSNTSVFIGETIRLSPKSQITGDTLVIAGTIEAHGRVTGDLILKGGAVTFSGTVDGDLDLTGTDIVLMPGAEIKGDFVYRSPKELILDRDIKLHGTMSRAAPLEPSKRSVLESLGLPVFHISAALLYGIVLMALLPRLSVNSSNILVKSIWKSLFTGFVVLSLMLTTAFFAFFTIAGIQLSMILLCACYILGYTGKIICGLAIGSMIFRSPGNSFLSLMPRMALGVILLYLATQTQTIGAVAWMAATLAGTGALLLAIFPRAPWKTRFHEQQQV